MYFIAHLLVGLLTVLMSVSAMAQSLPRTVLYFDQGPSNNPAARAISGAFQAKIDNESGGSVFVYPENLAIPIFGSAHYLELLHDHFREKYRDRPIGVIVTRGTATLPYALRLRDSLWPGTALVFTSVGESTVDEMKRPPNATGVTYSLRLNDMLGVARLLVPNLRTVAIVGDSLDSENAIRRYAPDLPGVAAQIEVLNWTGLPLAEVLERVATLPNDAAILYTNLITDSAGARFISRDVLPSIAKAASRPIVVDTEAAIGFGGTGGLLNTYEGAGEKAAQMVWRVLNGESASSIPISKGETTKWIFDWRQLQRFGIDESRLPPGSDIRFRPLTAWEQYRWQILLTAMALLVQTLLIVGLIYEHRRRSHAEVEARRRMGELAHMNRSAAIGEMSASIAHEINQPLAGIVMNAGSALRFLGSAPPQLDGVRTVLNMILRDGDRASNVVGTLRAMFKKDVEGRAPISINVPIRETLALLRSELDDRDVSVNLVLTEGLPQILGNRIQLQQVILNLIRNASDAMSSVNGRPRILRVRSEADEAGDVIVTIGDSGPGIDAEKLNQIFEPFFTTKVDGMGMGLSICRSIVEAHGGQLTAVPAKPSGMDFHIILPAAGAVK